MSDTDKKTEDQKFNDTLKRMLKTPPKPHEKSGDADHQESSRRKRKGDQDAS